MTPAAALELSRIAKRFGTAIALEDASLRVARGTVHALLGENGAGKTTLMRVAFGLVHPDSGKLRIDGSSVSLNSPREAIRRGVGMVHQHFTAVGAMTVAENVAVGGSGILHASAAADRVSAIGRETGLVLDPGALAGSLPASAQQRLEIVKALAHGARTLILDEPTAVLAPPEVEDLLRFLRGFADAAGAVVLITHKLREAISIADEVTVLRAGRTVAAIPRMEVSESRLARAMLGGAGGAGDLGDQKLASGGVNRDEKTGVRPQSENTTENLGADHQSSTPIIARAHGLSLTGERGVLAVRAVSLTIRAGELIGVAGVEGAGCRELLRALAGLLKPESGVVEIPDEIAFIPELRHRDGLVLEMSLAENLALKGGGTAGAKLGWRSSAAVKERLERFGIRGRNPSDAASTLSGGNQQKLVLARELHGEPPLIIAENPTRGLDIAATAAVHGHLRRAAERGAAVVFHSSDLDETLALSSRVVVMFAGVLTGVAPDRATVGAAMLGVS